jgi:hypothetical protein
MRKGILTSLALILLLIGSSHVRRADAGNAVNAAAQGELLTASSSSSDTEVGLPNEAIERDSALVSHADDHAIASPLLVITSDRPAMSHSELAPAGNDTLSVSSRSCQCTNRCPFSPNRAGTFYNGKFLYCGCL